LGEERLRPRDEAAPKMHGSEFAMHKSRLREGDLYPLEQLGSASLQQRVVGQATQRILAVKLSEFIKGICPQC